jgi:hypothetical protein
MMHLIPYKKKNKIFFLSFLVSLFLNSNINAQDVEVKTEEAIILRVGLLNKANKIWTLNYIVIDKGEFYNLKH